MDKNFCIKDGYIHRESYTHYSDIGYEDQYQDQVYQTALRIFEQNKLNTVFDVGCGSAFKLRKYFSKYNFTGAEIKPTLSWLKDNYSSDNWVLSDFKKSVQADLFICSDVIEHLVDPDELLNFFEKSNFKFIVLSTPERDAVQICQRGYLSNGPPLNPARFRGMISQNSYLSPIKFKFFIFYHILKRHLFPFQYHNLAQRSWFCFIVAHEVFQDFKVQ